MIFERGRAIGNESVEPLELGKFLSVCSYSKYVDIS